MEMLIYQNKICAKRRSGDFFSWNLQISPIKKKHHPPTPTLANKDMDAEATGQLLVLNPETSTRYDIATVNPDVSFPKGNRIPETGGISCFFFCHCLFSDGIPKVNRMMIQRKTGMNTQKGKTRLVQSLDVLVCRFFCIGVGNLWILEVLPSF